VPVQGELITASYDPEQATIVPVGR
jgi:hypothetical protein